MKYIFKLVISSFLLFLLVSSRAEQSKAQITEGYSVPSGDSTSVPASPTPDNPSNVSQKRHHHNRNNDGPTIDTLSAAQRGTNLPDTVVTNKKVHKKKKKDMDSDTLRVVHDIQDTSVTKTDTIVSAPVEEPAPEYIPLTPDQKASAIIEAANKLQGAGDYKTAILLFDSVINYYPRTFYYKYAFYYRGQAYAFDNKKDSSLNDLSSFIALDSCKSPFCSDAHYTRALVYVHQNDFNSAITDLNFILGHDSTFKNLKFVYFYRAFCYGSQNVFPKAIQDLTKFLFIDNMRTVASADALDSRAFYKIKLNDNRGAIADYDKAILLYTSMVQSSKSAKEDGYLDKLIDTYTQRGLAKAGINKFDEAIIDYNLALKFNQNFAKAYLLRGLAYINQSKQDLGCIDLSRAGELGATEAYDEIKKYCK